MRCTAHVAPVKLSKTWKFADRQTLSTIIELKLASLPYVDNNDNAELCSNANGREKREKEIVMYST